MIESLWATRVTIAENVHLHGTSVLGRQDGSSRVTPEEIAASAQFRREVLELAGADDEDDLKLEATVHSIDGGGFLRFSANTSVHRLFSVIKRSQPMDDEAGAGSLVLLDPRPGVQNVFVPGMPWNRSVSVPGLEGRILGSAGFVPFMLTPLGRGETMLLLEVNVWNRPESR